MLIINLNYLGYLIHESIKFLLLAGGVVFLFISKYMISIILLLLLIVVWLEEIKNALYFDVEDEEYPEEDNLGS